MDKEYAVYKNITALEDPSMDQVEIGKIVEIKTEQKVLTIVYDKQAYLHYGYHIVATDYFGEPVVVIDDTYRKVLVEHESIFSALIMHEFGHFVNGDLSEDNDDDIEAVRRKRLESIHKNIIDEKELKADAFAVSQMGKSAVINALDFLIRMRKQRNDSGAELAIKEFMLRKKAVQKMR